MVLLVGITLLVALALLASGDAQATVTGKPVPTPGNDWVIDTETYVNDEALISISGDIIILPGYTLEIRESKIVIESSTPGQHGILVDDAITITGKLVLAGSTIEALSSDDGWYLIILGDADISSSTLKDLQDGMMILGGMVTVNDCSISATGAYGVLIEGASPSITGTTIDLATDGQGTGIDVLSTPTVVSKPVLQDLVVRIIADVTMATTTATTNADLMMYGIRAHDSDLGMLSGIEIIHGATMDVTINNAGNPRLYMDLYSTGLLLEGSSSVSGFNNVTIKSEGYNIGVTYPGTRTFRKYVYNYVTGLDNQVNTTGGSPAIAGGITIADQVVSVTTTGTATEYDYDYSCGIVWHPDPAAVTGEDLTVQGIMMQNVSASLGMDVADGWNMTLQDSVFYECSLTGGVLNTDSWTHSVVIAGNTFTNCSANGREGDILHALKMWGDIEVKDNLVTTSEMGTFLTVDAPRGGVIVTGNNLTDNEHNYDLVLLTGLGILAENQVLVTGNEFNDNECQKIDHAMIMVEHPKQNITVNGNTFMNNTGDGICFMTPYSHQTLFPNPYFTFTVVDNHFEGTNGYSIAFINLDNNNLVVSDNTARGCLLNVIRLDQSVVSFSDSNHWGSISTYLQGPDSVTIRDNDLADNPGGGMDLRMSLYDSKYAENSGNPYAKLVIRDNDISGSGTRGWAISVEGLYNRPDIANNDLDGSVQGLHMGMIDDEVKRNPFVMIFDGQVMDGGSDGSIAFSFQGVTATFYNCTFVNYTHSIRTVDAEVTVLWSNLRRGSGYVITGSITVYNHLQVLTRWSNEDDLDSGMPVKGASVSLTAQDGHAIEALATDAAGRTPVTVIKVWEMSMGSFVANSPLKVAVSARGEYVEHYLPVESEMVGDGSAVLTLPDRHPPALTVSSPWSGSVLSTPDITLKGVLTEFGSGIVFFGARHDGMAADEWVDIDPSTLWACTFTGLTVGSHDFTVKVEDLSGNIVTVPVSITIDLEPPVLDWRPAHLDGTPLPFDEASMSYYITSTPVLINGTYEDDRTETEYIVIRLDGTIITALGGQLGKINFRVDLHEGTNLLMLDATDLAGNRRSVEYIVTLDSTAPVLYVTYPLSGLKTRDAVVTVQGLTEPATKLRFQVESSTGTRVYDHVETPEGDVPILSAEDGTFAFDVELFEGIQVLLVAVEDTAGNLRETEVDVSLDTQSPEFVLNSPQDDVTVTSVKMWQVVGTVAGEYGIIIIVNGQRYETTGVFTVEVPLHEGENLLEVTALDDVGNSHTETRTIIVDTLAPVLIVTSPEGDDVLTRDTAVHIAGTVVGATSVGGGAGVVLTIAGTDHDAVLTSGTWEDGAWEYTLELGATDLDQEITVTAADSAGNTDEATFRVRLDVIPPSLQINEPPSNTKASMLAINGTTDLSVMEVYVNGIAYPCVDGVFSANCYLVPGDNTITVVAMDEAGNSQTEVRTVNLAWEETADEPTTSSSEGTDSDMAYAIALVVAGLAVLVIAVLLAGGRRGGDGR
jgi:hypothetical protein